jgi:hypothetical protein
MRLKHDLPVYRDGGFTSVAGVTAGFSADTVVGPDDPHAIKKRARLIRTATITARRTIGIVHLL